MPSDLATALISGNAPGIAADPMLASIAPQIQLAQTLSQQGLSTAPAYPAQALGRLAQTLAGVKMMHDATGELQGVYGHAAESMSRIFPDDTPLGRALRDPDPYARMIALQQASKAMLLQSEPQKLRAGEQVLIGSQPTAANTMPQSEPGKVARDVMANPAVPRIAAGMAGQKAGAEAGARAPYEPGGEGVIQGPDGPQTIPITAATRNAMQPRAVPTVSVLGGGAGGPAPTAPQAPAQTSFNDRFSGVSGAPLKNPAIEPAVAADTKELAMDREKAIASQQDMATVRMIQDFMPKVQTGWSAETKLEGARILKAMGAPEDRINDLLKTDVASGQILQKKFLELSAAAARNMGAREPGSVIQMFAKAYPSLGTDPQAVQLQTNALYMDRMRNQAMATDKTNYLNESINGVQSTGKYRGLKGFNEVFDKAHPAESYLSAAEAMSGVDTPWKRIKNPAQQQQIINLIPPGSHFMAPDGRPRVKP